MSAIPKGASLNDVERLYREGFAGEEAVRAYLREWNATPGRFTQAVLFDSGIRNFDRENAFLYPKVIREECGVRAAIPKEGVP